MSTLLYLCFSDSIQDLKVRVMFIHELSKSLLSIYYSNLFINLNMAGSLVPSLECLVIGSLLPLLLLSTICSGHTIHYIKPTPSTPCPADPCFTLSEYAQQCLHNLTSNTTLLLLTGDHVLSVNFTVENISGFEILSSEDNDATRIVCEGLVGFSFRNILHMEMYGLTINSCGKSAMIYNDPTTYGASVHSVLDTSISNCSFQDSVGTALGVFQSSLEFRGSNHFISNCKRCGNYTCLCWGGGIYANMSTLTFAGNSTFRLNSATYGGGIYAEHNTFMVEVFSGATQLHIMMEKLMVGEFMLRTLL